MLLPSPEIQKRLDKYQTIDKLEADAISFERRKYLLQKAALKTLTVLASLSIPLSLYAADVNINRFAQAEAEIDVHVGAEALDPANNNKAIIFLDGFRSTSGDNLIKYRGDGLQAILDAQLWSVGYNNANLSPEVIAEKIIALAKEKGVTTIYLYGESAGGPIAMQVHADVAEDSDITIAADVLNSAPDGAGGLRQPRQDEIKLVETLSVIPGAKYSSLVRFIGEMAFRSDRYMDDDGLDIWKAFATTGDVIEDIQGSDIAGTWLMFDQLMAIEDAKIRDRVIEMGLLSPEVQHPVIIYIGTSKPGYDYIVNDDLSADNIRVYADEAGITYIVIEVPGAVHSRPDIGVEAFNETLLEAEDEIHDAITAQEKLAALNASEALKAKQNLDTDPTVDQPLDSETDNADDDK